jgi:hypothetical protein
LNVSISAILVCESSDKALANSVFKIAMLEVGSLWAIFRAPLPHSDRECYEHPEDDGGFQPFDNVAASGYSWDA